MTLPLISHGSHEFLLSSLELLGVVVRTGPASGWLSCSPLHTTRMGAPRALGDRSLLVRRPFFLPL